jgi:soluble lytic murein transglycosylase-like protein
MILRATSFAVGRAAAAALGAAALGLAATPARADVLQIEAGGAHWLTGPAAGNLPAAPDTTSVVLPLAEVPSEALLVPEPAVADLAVHGRQVPASYAAKVAELAERYDLSPALIEALVWQESRWRADAVSPVGARGLAQLMPGTARELGVDARDPFANLEGGARYLRAQLDRFDGDIEKALAAYNAGPGRVIRSGGIPRIRETQVYVASIMGRLSDHSRSSD